MTAHRPRVLVVAGTRPECLKLASVVRALRAQPSLDTQLLNSGQHEAMVARTFGQLGLSCDLVASQIVATSLSQALSALRDQIRHTAQDQGSALIVSQGDTSTAYAAALAARDLGLPLAHVEAGLRTSHPYRPFPEEHFRRRIAPIAGLHFAPTRQAAANLRNEGVPAAHIHQVGNSVIDLLREQIEDTRPLALPFLPDTPRLIALTLHRRENYGRGLDLVCAAVLDLLTQHSDIGIVCPVHPNPTVGHRIRRHLSGHARISLVEPLDYRPFIAVLAQSCLAITDSGGIQEEAPYLGTPVLVVRENTERPESVALGTATLVPPRTNRIVAEANRLLATPAPLRLAFTPDAAYGDGRSGERIARIISDFMG